MCRLERVLTSTIYEPGPAASRCVPAFLSCGVAVGEASCQIVKFTMKESLCLAVAV